MARPDPQPTPVATVTLDTLDAIPGHITNRLGHELYRLAAAVPAGQTIVNIGVYLGKSTCYLAAGAQAGHGAHVWGIDPWDLPGDRGPTGAKHRGRRRSQPHRYVHAVTRRRARRHVRRVGLRRQVTLIREFSAEVGALWDGPPVGLLFIDGDHTAQGVHADWAAWRPHLAKGAVIAWDDYARSHPDVIAIVSNLAAAGEVTAPEVLADRLAVTRLTTA